MLLRALSTQVLKISRDGDVILIVFNWFFFLIAWDNSAIFKTLNYTHHFSRPVIFHYLEIHVEDGWLNKVQPIFYFQIHRKLCKTENPQHSDWVGTGAEHSTYSSVWKRYIKCLLSKCPTLESSSLGLSPNKSF